MSDSLFATSDLTTFDAPTALPRDDQEASQWQDANRSWWESHPMRYDWRSDVAPVEFSREYYEEIDKRFYVALKQLLPWKSVPFDSLIDYGKLASQDMLEIGVGCGTHAQLLASRAGSYHGIDLTEFAVETTSRRLDCFGIEGTIKQMDAEKCAFPDNSFDFVWSWGVIHHSSNTLAILEQIHRVLRPGGRAVIMVYHSSWWVKYFIGAFLCGCLRGEFFRGKSLHDIVQSQTDGAIARYYSSQEWRDLVPASLEVQDIQIMGQKELLIPLPGGRVKDAVAAILPNAIARFITNNCQQGSMLVSTLRKPDG